MDNLDEYEEFEADHETAEFWADFASSSRALERRLGRELTSPEADGMAELAAEDGDSDADSAYYGHYHERGIEPPDVRNQADRRRLMAEEIEYGERD